jgi:hypothetical protein
MRLAAALAAGPACAVVGSLGCGLSEDQPPLGAGDSGGGGDAHLSSSSDGGAGGDTGTGPGSDAASGGDGGAAHKDGSSPQPEAGPTPTHKRGVAYGQNTDADLAALSAGIYWWYNWSPHPDSTLSAPPANVEFVPMIWGGSFDPAKVEGQIPAGAQYLLAFNEPNFGNQANLTPAQAAALWPKIEEVAHAKNLKIVSPALNYCGGNCNATDPFDWLDQFFAACSGCQVDYIGAHWYACSKDALGNYLAQYEAKYKQPIWLTEFSCLDDTSMTTVDGETAYMKDAVALLEADPHVFRYSWFTGRFAQQSAIDLLAGSSGTLTALGQQYVTLP